MDKNYRTLTEEEEEKQASAGEARTSSYLQRNHKQDWLIFGLFLIIETKNYAKVDGNLSNSHEICLLHSKTRPIELHLGRGTFEEVNIE